MDPTSQADIRTTFTGFRWTYFASLRDGPIRSRATSFLASVDWQALEKYAADKRNGIKCFIRPDVGLGGNHMVRIIEFTDGIRWVARLQLPALNASSSMSEQKTSDCEVHTVSFLRKRTNLPLPIIYSHEARSNCGVNAPFILMNCFEGNVGMDLGMEIPSAFKRGFLSDVAKLHVQLSTVLLPQIGTIESVDADGVCHQGPIPGLGGPFDTATGFFKAWASNARFRMTEKELQEACGSHADAMHQSISSFPTGLQRLADRLSVLDKGPFPLCHGDFGHNNIIVDDTFQVIGIIDWEAAFAGPWDIFADFPLHLSTIPPVMDAPSNYNEDGSPKDTVVAQKLLDQDDYVAAVVLEEERIGAQAHRLSQALKDVKRRHLATAMRLYMDGKPGWYSQVIDQFDSVR